MRSAQFSRTDLNQLQRQLRIWRESRPPRTRLPDQLWKAAAALAGRYGVSYVAGHLRLEYNKLRRKLETQSLRSSRMAPTAAPKGFVELRALELPGLTGGACTVELSDGGGEKMTVQLAGEASALVALAEAFWRRRR